jgi:hypothetical protein
MNRLEKIERDMARARERITEWQSKLKELDRLRTEQENLEIVSAVRAIGMTREELLTFISGGSLPAVMQGGAAIPAVRYSRGKPRPKTPEPDSGSGGDGVDGTTSFSDSEREEKADE